MNLVSDTTVFMLERLVTDLTPAVSSSTITAQIEINPLFAGVGIISLYVLIFYFGYLCGCRLAVRLKEAEQSTDTGGAQIGFTGAKRVRPADIDRMEDGDWEQWERK